MIKAVYLIRFGGENLRLLPEYNPGRDPEAMGCEGDGRAGSSRHDSLTRFIHQGPPEAGAQLAMTRGPGLLASHDRAGAPRAIRGFASARPGRSRCDLRQPTGVPQSSGGLPRGGRAEGFSFPLRRLNTRASDGLAGGDVFVKVDSPR